MNRILCTVSFALLVTVSITLPTQATIYGTMSNFDVFNETEYECHGAEIELEGIHIEDLNRTFPSHFDYKSVEEYNDGTVFGTRIIYTGYNFNGVSFLSPTTGQSTNGHSCVDTPGCEHFGFSVVGTQPTAARYYWLDANGNRFGNAPMGVPTPTWTYIPGANGGAPRLLAEVEPVEVEEQQPDSVWMKVFKTEIERPVELAELMSGNGIVPENVGETETEWELLEGGTMDQAEDEIGDGKQAVIRRYEFYEYAGLYDNEHEPITIFLDQDLPEPPEGELGQFISANMVAANLEAPARTYGDYNGDGVVNAADYTVWRDSLGSEIEYEADGDDDGIIDMDDFYVWRNGFGQVLDQGGGPGPGGAGAGANVPEPATGGLALLGSAIFWMSRRRQNSIRTGGRV